MDTSLGSILDLYQFTSGRRLFAYFGVQKQARIHKLTSPALDAHITLAIKHDHNTRKLERKWRTQKGSKTTVDLRPLDYSLDRSVTSISRHCENFTHAMDPGHPLYILAAEITTDFFPEGPGAITQLEYEEEISTVDEMIEALNTPKYQEHVQKLHLTPLLDNTKKRSEALHQALQKNNGPEITFGDVKAARAKGQQLLEQMIAIIIGTYYNNESHTKPRQQLLEPVMKQQARIADLMKRHRPVNDVNPETGEDETEDTPPQEDPQTTEEQKTE
ncbi:MAG TPA: hypothetical protein DCE42_11205 [Myxococcales bacterium]|nr:hypothetical protein [Deltaproteobacteria bacterium]MBU47192.1 hypothetical protein [Deltaproteobacteria bacterium]HAA55316.1 hypothetical protein [Myxococcales bacterium]|tara:strand:- start:776 stop:1597 length:822 start_codon:yes stop_codon:yes gene_type:complete